MDQYYCQLCAEQKNANKLINLLEQPTLMVDMTRKLNFLNLNALDSLSFACLTCVEDLSKACNFVERFYQAQKQLIDIKQCDKKVGDGNVIQNDGKFNTSIKLEILNENSSNLDPDNCDDSIPPDIKVEDDEIPTENEVLNIQDIIPNLALPNNVYGKEVKPRKSKTTWANYPWSCYMCCIQFAELKSLREHSKETHKRCNQFYCVDCDDGREFKNFDTFVKHVIQRHWSSLKYMCPYCHVKVECISSHLEDHYSEGRLCKDCGEILPTEEAYNQHLNTITVNNKVRKKNRKRGAPYTEDELTCKLCNKIYKSANSLRAHHVMHEKNRQKEQICDQCGKAFYKKATLVYHIQTQHEVTKLPYNCKICQKGFLFQNMLKRHVLTHSNIKPFACDKCNKCFRLSYQLKMHQMVHTDALPYICRYCAKAFKYRQLLTTHERQHTGLRPYSCKDCDMLFTNWSNYNKHMKRRHNMDTAKKKITPNGVFPTNPDTGKMIEIEAGCEEWRNNVLVQPKGRKRKGDKTEILI